MKSRVASAFLLLCTPVPAAVMSFSAVADTSIFEANPNYDLGGTSLVSGTNQQYSRSRAMFRFDVSALPEGAVVTAAEVSLYVSRRPDPDQHGGPTDSDFSLYRLYVSWGEGTATTATGSGAAPGDATWNERHFGTAAWANPGALAGVDYANNPSATKGISGVGGYVWASTPELLEDVRAWRENPAENFGFILVSQNESGLGTGRRFGSIEQPGATIPPPALTITYTLVPEPAVSTLCVLALAGLALRRGRR